MAQPYLSFNEQFGGKGSFGVPEEPDEETKKALAEPMKLRDTWVLWEQVEQKQGKMDKYGDATRKVTKFSTVQEFFGIWNGLPQPSELLEQRCIMRDMPNAQPVAIDAIMVFKDGIRPEWEDAQNASGGHFQIQLRPSVGGGQIDEYWNNIVLGMIGGTLEHSEMVTGIRLVDKLSGPKAANAIRIELWFKNYSDSTAVAALRRSMENCLATKVDGTRSSGGPKPDTKAHNSLSKH